MAAVADTASVAAAPPHAIITNTTWTRLLPPMAIFHKGLVIQLVAVVVVVHAVHPVQDADTVRIAIFIVLTRFVATTIVRSISDTAGV